MWGGLQTPLLFKNYLKGITMSDAQNVKLAALQQFVNAYYVPAFIKTCAAQGLSFENETDLAHALQLNGKLAAMVASGASIDALIDSVVSNLNVKHAHDGGIDVSLGLINYALDASLGNAGVPVSDMNKAAAADSVVTASDEELLTFLNIVA